MNRTADSNDDGHSGGPPIIPNDEIYELRLAYQRAFDEYVDATTAINERIRRRILPTGEEFARQRVAQFALVEARRAFSRASKSRKWRPH